ncbi:GGDEF domain-containing protein [Isachenkonia alkalipeptolytica]|uniref:GGDEF domain-containing protein n=1 Tax=Isachenkonia alkalipeptolytica TaxID=2565777 RepID=A0AA44BD49_9CLOT|nr:GGDEF domain-containing protein [Isachenkonia alkalipeptolytica]NBG87523.1 GGDEF domain-containing protein [Isachenkonia alkalipeptolytica]
MEAIKKSSIILFVFMLFSLFVLLTLVFSGGDYFLRDDSVSSLNEGWEVIDSEVKEEGGRVTLPLSTDTPAGEALILQRELGPDFAAEQTLLIRSSLQDLEVHLDREVLFQQSLTHRQRVTPPIVSLWNLVTIPEDASGRKLTLFLTSPFETMSGEANDILYGSPGSLMMAIIYQYGPGFFVAVLTLLIGLSLVLLPRFIRGIYPREMVYLGYFGVFISLWLISESRMLQFFTGNQFLIGSLAYVMLSIFPIPLILYLKKSITNRYPRVLNAMILAYLINLLLIITLEVTGVLRFFQTLAFSHGLMVLTILISAYILYREVRNHQNREARIFLRSLSVLFLFGFIELFHFYFLDAQQTSQFIRVGLLLFILIQSFDSINRLVGYFKKSYRAEVYEKMAYMDQLTSAPNRMAYNRDLQEFFKHPEKLRDFYLGIFDLNNLKTINDTRGHVTGDEAIIRSYNILHSTFAPYGTCYRIGGDEFSCILPELEKETLKELQEKLDREINTQGKKLSYPLSIAAGYSYYKPNEDKNLEDLIHRADQRMYQDKREKKSIPSV